MMLVKRIALAFAFLPLVSLGQELKRYDTLPTMPGHYENKYSIFKKEPLATGKIIFLGNSITEGGNWMKLLNRTDVVNRGIGGDVTFGILNRLKEIMRHKPRKIFLLIGVNDLSKKIPEDVILRKYREIIDQIRNECPQTKLYVQSLFPVNPHHERFPFRYNKRDEIESLNKGLEQMASEAGVVFIDLYSPFFDKKRGVLKIELTDDGLHLNQAGYNVWSEILKARGVL